MTRETKIGLLVGLAFIIVIGVLLSDHIQTATQPQSAVLARSSEAVDRSVAAPGKENPGAVAVHAPDRVEPIGLVATSDHEANRPEPVVTVSRGGEATQASDVVVSMGDRSVAVTPVARGNSGVAAGGPTTPVVMGEVAGGVVTPEVATVVTPGGPTGKLVLSATTDAETKRAVMGATATAPAPHTAVASSGTKYKAVEGDNLWKITARVYGKWSKANSDLILKENPQMGPKGEKIVIGQVYVIPSLSPAVAGAEPVATVPAPVAVKTVPTLQETVMGKSEKAVAPVAVNNAFKAYKVKDGDSLWKIAKAMGRPQAEIEAANKDVLKGAKVLKVGMVLKIPVAEKTATASAQ